MSACSVSFWCCSDTWLGGGGGNVSSGAGSENKGLPGADRLPQLQVQDADDEGQARHHAADGDRGGGAGGGAGGPARGAPPRDLGPPLRGHGKEGARLAGMGAAPLSTDCPPGWWPQVPCPGLILGISARACRLELRKCQVSAYIWAKASLWHCKQWQLKWSYLLETAELLNMPKVGAAFVYNLAILLRGSELQKHFPA